MNKEIQKNIKKLEKEIEEMLNLLGLLEDYSPRKLANLLYHSMDKEKLKVVIKILQNDFLN